MQADDTLHIIKTRVTWNEVIIWQLVAINNTYNQPINQAITLIIGSQSFKKPSNQHTNHRIILFISLSIKQSFSQPLTTPVTRYVILNPFGSPLYFVNCISKLINASKQCPPIRGASILSIFGSTTVCIALVESIKFS